MLASDIIPATAHATWSSILYIFSVEVEVWRSFEVTFFSPTRTTPSFDRIPIAEPAFPIASIAYSTWYRRPSGEKIVVRLSYLRDIYRGRIVILHGLWVRNHMEKKMSIIVKKRE